MPLQLLAQEGDSPPGGSLGYCTCRKKKLCHPLPPQKANNLIPRPCANTPRPPAPHTHLGWELR